MSAAEEEVVRHAWLHILANFWRVRRRVDPVEGVTLWYYRQPRKDALVVLRIKVDDQ